jgi:hypothetical protein
VTVGCIEARTCAGRYASSHNESYRGDSNVGAHNLAKSKPSRSDSPCTPLVYTKRTLQSWAMEYFREKQRSRPDRDEMNKVFQFCRADNWFAVYQCVERNPMVAVEPMIMDNHIATSILHQAITSKGDTEIRANLIRRILEIVPQAAAIKNGYGSLPLHVIAQRNTKMDAQTKEKLIFELVKAHKNALMEQGGVGKRTPLHIIFTGKSLEQ